MQLYEYLILLYYRPGKIEEVSSQCLCSAHLQFVSPLQCLRIEELGKRRLKESERMSVSAPKVHVTTLYFLTVCWG